MVGVMAPRAVVVFSAPDPVAVFSFPQNLSVENLAIFPRNLITHHHKKSVFYLKQHLSRGTQTGSDAPSHLGLTSLIEHRTLHDPRTPDLVRSN